MEKINYHKHELAWIDGLLRNVDSARRILVALKQSRQEETKPTYEQKRMLGLLGLRYTSHVTQQDAKKMIDCRCTSILESIVERGHRPYKGHPFSFSCLLHSLKGGNDSMELKDLPGIHVLPILKLPDTSYFIDLVLKQFREVDNPFNFIGFDSSDGKILCKYAKIVSCSCGVCAIVARPSEARVCCTHSLHTLE